jgi:hypothetical protein
MSELEKVKLVEKWKNFILDLEKSAFKYNVEIYLRQGYYLRCIKNQITGFNVWVAQNMPFEIATAYRRLQLYDTARERQLILSELSHLNNNVLQQIAKIWHEMIEYKKVDVEKQQRLSDKFVKESSRILSRIHPDRESYYSNKIEDKQERLTEKIIKQKREIWTIRDGLESNYITEDGWLNQFEVWKEHRENNPELIQAENELTNIIQKRKEKFKP